MARLCLILMLWSMAPWQWLCYDHDHHGNGTVNQIEHEEASRSIHGCQIDFFAPYMDEPQGYNQKSSTVLLIWGDLKLMNPCTILSDPDGRSPPTFLFPV